MIMTLPAMLLAALLPAAPADDEPRCRAELEGARLTTTIAFPDGYSVEAPWKVLQTQQRWAAEQRSVLVVDMSLDRIVEADGITGQRQTTPLASPIVVTFEAPSQPELVHQAAQTWCQTVLEARETTASAQRSSLPLVGRAT